MPDHASQSVSSLSTQASSNQAVRNSRIYQIMLVAHELVLEGKFCPFLADLVLRQHKAVK